MTRARSAISAVFIAMWTGACGAAATTTDAGIPGADAAGPTTFAEQAALGATEYGAHCASCHGAGGEGSATVPPLVGLADGALPLEPRPGAVRTTRFETVADVASFAVVNMPADAPGSLSAEQYWAILAFDLSANGIMLDEMLTPALAATLTIPR